MDGENFPWNQIVWRSEECHKQAVFTESSLLTQEAGGRDSALSAAVQCWTRGLGGRKCYKNVLSCTTLCHRNNSCKPVVESWFFPYPSTPPTFPPTNTSYIQQAPEEMKDEQWLKKKWLKKSYPETMQKEWLQGTGKTRGIWIGLMGKKYV